MTHYNYLYKLGMLLVLISLILAGCNTMTSNSTAGATAVSASAFKVAMILPGEINDKSWSQAGYEGLELVQKELKAQVAYTANVTDSDAEKVFSQYAEEGYDFIIGHGGEYIQAAEIVAEKFPRIKFAVVAGYAGNNKNLGALSFRDGELGYLTGVVAALKTKTNKVAFIGGMSYPHMQEQAALFERGARDTNPAVEVSVEWLDSWTDAAKARAVAQKVVQSEFDVLLANSDAASQVIVEVAQDAGVYAIGWSLDQHELAPNTVLTSGIQRIPVLMLEGAALVQQGRWEGKQYKFGVQEEAQGLAPFYGLLTPQEEDTVKKVRQDILSGKIDVTP